MEYYLVCIVGGNMPNKNENTMDSLDKIIGSTFEKLKNIVDANTSIGEMVKLGSNKFIIPISRINVGVISGGGEIPVKKKTNKSAGSTTGFSITPIGFVVVTDNNINYISTEIVENNTTRVIESLIGLTEKYINNRCVDEEEK